MSDIAQIQDSFERVLPRIRSVVKFRLRRLHGEEKDEATAETLAVCWEQYVRLTQAGREPDAFIGRVAEFAAKRVLSGRPLTGQRGQDVLSPQYRHRNPIMPSISPTDNDDVPGVLGNLRGREPDPAEQGLLNAEIAEWLEGLSPEERTMAAEFAAGATNTDVGESRGLSRGWGSLVRCRLRESCPFLPGR